MWEIALVIAVIVFSITCFFVIQTLIAIQRSLLAFQIKAENLSAVSTHFLDALDARVNSLGSTFRSISNLGDICESKTEKLKVNYLNAQTFSDEKPNVGEELVNLAMTSIRLYQQFTKK